MDRGRHRQGGACVFCETSFPALHPTVLHTMRVPPTGSTGLDHTNSDRPSSPPLPLSIRYPLRWIFIPLLAGFNLGQSVGADSDGATSVAPSGLSTRVTVLATGKGFVRLSYEATLTDTDSTEPLVERMAPRHLLAASMVGLPRGVQPSLHVLEARPSSRRSSEVDSDLLLDGPVQLGAPVQLRDQYAVPVRFAPRREGDGRIVVYDRVVVDVIFDDPGRVSGWPERDEHFEPIYTSLLINESQARRWRRRPARHEHAHIWHVGEQRIESLACYATSLGDVDFAGEGQITKAKPLRRARGDKTQSHNQQDRHAQTGQSKL